MDRGGDRLDAGRVSVCVEWEDFGGDRPDAPARHDCLCGGIGNT